MTTGSVSEPLEMPYGFHILFAENVQIGELRSLDVVRDELRMRLEDERYAEKLSEFMVKARSESEWCVKPKFVAALPSHHAQNVCEEM